MRIHLAACAAAVAGMLAVPAARAGDFYKGRPLVPMVGNNAGTAYEASARLIARYFGRHVPGGSAIVVHLLGNG